MYDTHAQRLKPLSNQGGRAVCNQLMQRLMHSPLPALAAPCALTSPLARAPPARVWTGGAGHVCGARL